MPVHCLPAVVTRRAAPPFRRLLLACLLLLAASSAGAGPAAAQNAIERADPPLEGTVTVAPAQIGIWFAEPLLDDPDAITIQLIDSAGTALPLGSPSIYAVDTRHVSVPVASSPATGTYSVLWTAQFAGDQLERSGGYGFRIAPAGLAGAATEVDAFPAFWAIAARLLILIGLALAVGGLIAGGSGSALTESRPIDRGRHLLVIGGGGLALLGTIAGPAFAALLTGPSPPASMFAGYPADWWPRAGALLVLIAAGVVMHVWAANSNVRLLVWLAAAFAGAVALVATCASGLAIRQAPPDAVAASAVVVIQAVIVLLTGMLVHVALFTPSLPRGDQPGPAPGPAIRALPAGLWLTAALAAVALIGTVVLGARLIPGVQDLIERLFGQVLTVTTLLLAAILLLAIGRRRNLAATGRRGLVALAALSLVSATVLALVVPPSGAAMPASLAAVNIVSPVPLTVAGEPGLVHLQYQPVTVGENAFIVWLTNAAGVTPPAAEQPDFAIELRSLSHDSPPITASAVPADTGSFAVATASLDGTGWWQATVTVTPDNGEAATAELFFLAPDPNVSGFGPDPRSSAAAAAVFERGLAAMTALRQVQFSTLIGGGAGTFARSEITVDDGSDGSTRGYQERAASYETVIIGDQQWLRFDGGDWSERQAGYIYVPADWGATYERATGFALGPIVEAGGEPSQVVTFWLPRQDQPRQEPAWFAWWVGTETGQVHRETMISNRHYMVYDFEGFNQPVEITAPADI